MGDYRHGAHVFEIHLHLVWVTKYRTCAWEQWGFGCGLVEMWRTGRPHPEGAREQSHVTPLRCSNPALETWVSSRLRTEILVSPARCTRPASVTFVPRRSSEVSSVSLFRCGISSSLKEGATRRNRWSRARRPICEMMLEDFEPAEPYRGDVTEIVNANEIRKPPCARFSRRKINPIAPLPVIRDPAPDPLNRSHCISLIVGESDDPTEPNANHEHKNNQPPHAECRNLRQGREMALA